MPLPTALRLRAARKPMPYTPACTIASALCRLLHADGLFSCPFHNQRMRHSALSTLRPRDKVSVSSEPAASESASTSVAYRCLRSCLSQHLSFNDAAALDPDAPEATQTKRKIEIVVKPCHFRLPDGKMTCVYNVYTGISQPSPQVPALDALPPEIPPHMSKDEAGAIVASKPMTSLRVRHTDTQPMTENLDCSISLIPQMPWNHEDMVELSHLAALRFAFPAAYASLVASIPSLSPAVEGTTSLAENGPTDVYTPLVRFYIQTERSALAALRKLVHKICYLAEKVEVLAVDPVETQRLSLSIYAETVIDAAEGTADEALVAAYVERAQATLKPTPLAKLGGISVSVEQKKRVGAPRDAGSQLITLTATTDCADFTWFGLYMEALRLVDPVMSAVFQKMLAKDPLLHGARAIFDVQKARKRIAETLRAISGRYCAIKVGVSSDGPVAERFWCAALSRANGSTQRVVLHHTVGASHIEALMQMHHFIVTHYLSHIGVRNTLKSANFNVTPENQISEAKLRALLPCAGADAAGDSKEASLRFVLDLLETCGASVSISSASDNGLRHCIDGDGSPELCAVVISVRHGENAKSEEKPLRTFLFIGKDYESTLKKAATVFFGKCHPKHQSAANVYFTAQRALAQHSKEHKQAETTKPCLLGVVLNQAPVALLNKMEAKCEDGPLPAQPKEQYGIGFADAPGDATPFCPTDIFDESGPGTPALAVFYAQHRKRSGPPGNAISAYRKLATTYCCNSLRPLVARLIHLVFGPSAVLNTHVYRRERYIAANSSFIESCMRSAAKHAATGLYSGFAWVTIQPGSAKENAVDRALQTFLRQESPASPSQFSIVAVTYNQHSREDCAAALDAAVLGNLFPETYEWLSGISKQFVAKGTCCTQPPQNSLSFVPPSIEVSRLDLLRESVAAYFGCGRLREVAVRTGCLFDIFLLHPQTNEQTGLSIRGASSPLLGLQDLYEGALLSTEHSDRFAACRRRFIAREAVLFRGATHRAADSLVQFVRRQMLRAVGLDVHFEAEWHLEDLRWTARAIGSNGEGRRIELFHAPNANARERAVLISEVAMTLCKMFFPNAMPTANRLNTDAASPYACDFASNTLDFRADLPLPAKQILPAPMLPCALTEILGAVRARTDSADEFQPVDIQCTKEADGHQATIHIEDEAHTCIVTFASPSPLVAAQECCRLLLDNMRGREWSVQTVTGQTCTLRLVRPLERDATAIPLPPVRFGHGQLMRVLRHSLITFFGLEATAALSTKARKISLSAIGAHRQRLSLYSDPPEGRTASLGRVCRAALALHFPRVMAEIEKLYMSADPAAQLGGEAQKSPCAAMLPSYAIPPSRAKCTLQLMRAAYAATFHHEPVESVKISSFDRQSIAVAILDDKRAPVERHASRSLPFSLMECYGNIFKTNAAAMNAFEALEKGHPYRPPAVSGAGEGAFELLEYLVRYELGLEIVVKVDVQRVADGARITVILSGAAPGAPNGQVIGLGKGWHTSEDIARTFAALIAIKTHFPLYYGKHRLRMDVRGEEARLAATREVTPKLE